MMSPLEWSLLVALIVAVSLALILLSRLTALRRGRHGTQVPVTPRRRVLVTVVKDGNNLSVKVDPWLVAIERGPATPQPQPEWSLQTTGLPGPLQWQLRSKANSGWPFSGRDPTPMVSGNAPIRPGTVTGKVAEHYQYTILIEHSGGELEIDPDIFIF